MEAFLQSYGLWILLAGVFLSPCTGSEWGVAAAMAMVGNMTGNAESRAARRTA